MTELEPALIVGCSSIYGFVVTARNALDHTDLVVFGPWTRVGELSAIDLGALDEVFHVGMQVLIRVEPSNDAGAGADGEQRIQRVEFMQPQETSRPPPALTAMVTVATEVGPSHAALAMNKAGQLAFVHPHQVSVSELGALLTDRAVPQLSAADCKKQFNDFFKTVRPGRTLEGRLIPMPLWLRPTFAARGLRVDAVALSIQNLSATVAGYAKLVGLNEDVMELRTAERPEERVVFPLALIEADKRPQCVANSLLGSLFYFEAARDLPGSDYHLRAFLLRLVEEGPGLQLEASSSMASLVQDVRRASEPVDIEPVDEQPLVALAEQGPPPMTPPQGSDDFFLHFSPPEENLIQL